MASRIVFPFSAPPWPHDVTRCRANAQVGSLSHHMHTSQKGLRQPCCARRMHVDGQEAAIAKQLQAGANKTTLGAVAEWFKAAVLKTAVPKGTGGSNPSCSGAFFLSRRRIINLFLNLSIGLFGDAWYPAPFNWQYADYRMMALMTLAIRNRSQYLEPIPITPEWPI
jgi:hypothetical protein